MDLSSNCGRNEKERYGRTSVKINEDNESQTTRRKRPFRVTEFIAGDGISPMTVRRIILNKGIRIKRRPYKPRSIPIHLHPTVKLLVDKLYEEENTRTTNEIIDLIKEETGVEVWLTFIPVD